MSASARSTVPASSTRCAPDHQLPGAAMCSQASRCASARSSRTTTLTSSAPCCPHRPCGRQDTRITAARRRGPVSLARPMNPPGRVGPACRRRSGGPAPKEQPPRNLSGHWTGRVRQRWKAVRPGPPGTGSGSPTGKARQRRRVKLSGTDDSGGRHLDALGAQMPTPLSQLAGHDDFVGRHIGPTDAEIEQMLDVIGAKSLDDLLDQTVPASIRSDTPLDLPGGALRARGARRAAGLADRNTLRTSLIGMGYTATVHAGRDPAQRARGPGLVHGLHAVPAGDQPGPPRGAAQLPDDGQRADRAARRQRLAARRGDRRRRGDGDGPPAVAGRRATASSSTTTPIRRRSPCCARGPSRSASTSSSATSTSVADGCFGALFSLPDLDRAPSSTGATPIDAVHAAGGLAVVATDLLACVLTIAARASSAPTSPSGRPSASACRWGSAARTPRSSPPTRRAARALPGPPRRRQHRHRRPAGAAPRAADPRAAHPPGEGDVEHLHGPGAAGQHRRLLRRLARPGRAAAHRRAGRSG